MPPPCPSRKTSSYGERIGRVLDPAGNAWSIATHVEDVTPEQMAERMAQMMGEG